MHVPRSLDSFDLLSGRGLLGDFTRDHHFLGRFYGDFTRDYQMTNQWVLVTSVQFDFDENPLFYIKPVYLGERSTFR